SKRHSTPTKDSMTPFSNRTMYASVSHPIEQVTTVLGLRDSSSQYCKCLFRQRLLSQWLN
ncbi:MAG: hypothetical protein WAL42_10000, partial [Nitrososphaeraceae archaeon]